MALFRSVVSVALVWAGWGLVLGPPAAASAPRLSEVLANHHAPLLPGINGSVDWAELVNESDAELNLSGMSLSDRPETPQRWVFPEGSLLAPRSYLVVVFDPNQKATTTPARYPNTGYALNSSGDKVYLFDSSGAGGGLIDNIVFGLQIEDRSIGRTPGSGEWSLNEPTPGKPNLPAVLGDPKKLKINEWMARPAKGSDWFEIFNPDPLPVALGNLFLSDLTSKLNLSRVPALSFIGGGSQGYSVFVADKNPANGADHVVFKLNKDGGTIILTDKDGKTKIDRIIYGPQSLGISEGRLPDGGGKIASLSDGPSPASANFLLLRDIIFNEVLSHADDPYEDALEFFNVTASSIDLSGYYITDNPNQPRRFRVPDGTIIDPRGYSVFYRFQFQPHPGVLPSFGLSSAHGDSLYLFGVDAQGSLNGWRTDVVFPAAANNIPFTLHNSSIGPQLTPEVNLTMGTPIRGTDPEELLPLLRSGNGAPNSPPLIELMVINEVHYNPPAENAVGESPLDEFIELRSLASTDLPLFDPAFPSNVWWLAGSVDYAFPRGVVVAPESSVLVVGFDPTANPSRLAAFRARYSLSQETPIFGPYRGELGNTNGSVQLFRPDIPQFCFDPDYGWVPPIQVDHVEYANTDPWPSAANGGGYSLQRKDLGEFGNDPLNWFAATPTPGHDNASPPQSLPVLEPFPSELSILAGESSSLVARTHGAVTGVEWRFNGELIKNANATTLSLGAATSKTTGNYSVLVSNPYGATSGSCFVRVLMNPEILTQPASQAVPPGG
ncbi:MAG: lamin tail domain-containing protein, partial [Verrucomicrobia bacterium]|nr:lamin tail domain-containing protein [Verrucomicrobiota bacterium]